VTSERTAAQLQTLQQVAATFLDVVSGLPTLRIVGAAKRQIGVIQEIRDPHRVTTVAARPTTG